MLLRHAADAERGSSGKIILPQDSEIEKPVKNYAVAKWRACRRSDANG
ncbi:hypothetical protein FB99_02690 [Pantoea agglomerans]|nr:hypothetical protein FB99_02690 [Pantoea agglomerans]